MQIIVLGMHRSGTSLTTRLINMLGVYFGPEGISHGFSRGNPKGYWERKDVLAINEQLLALNGCGWNLLTHWDPGKRVTMSPELRTKIQMTLLEMDAHRPWVLKDPRMCILFPYWKQFMEVPVAVIVYRDPREIAKSLETRDKMSFEDSMAVWEYHVVNLLNSSMDIPRLHVWHQAALENPVEFTRQLKQALEEEGVGGLRQPSEREILAFIDPKLYRARSGDSNSPALTAHHERLVRLISGQEYQEEMLEVSDFSKQRMKQMQMRYEKAASNG